MGLLSVLFAIFTGTLVRQELVGSTKLGVFSEKALFLAEIPVTLSKYIGLDIRSPEQRFPSIAGFQGKPLQEEVYLLLSKYDGDKKKSVVELIDLRTFEVKKTWNPDINQINAMVDTSLPEFENLIINRNLKRYRMIHPFLTEDGGLIFQHGSPLVKIDKNSQLVWQNQDDVFHHSIEQDHEGNFWVPTHTFPYQIDKKYVGSNWGTYDDDAITKVSGGGEILFQKSVSNILIENNLEFLLFGYNAENFEKDPLHLNDIEPVMTDGPYWKRGDLFLSLAHRSLIILYRPSSNKIIWKGRGHTSLQHDIDILDNNRISIFNNNWKSLFNGSKIDGNNEVVIYDFSKDSYSKYFNESLGKYDVRTTTEGLSQILNNGDLFIEEQNYGRLLYFNKDASIQWQYVNRINKENVYLLNWSRILFKPEDIKKIGKIIKMEDSGE